MRGDFRLQGDPAAIGTSFPIANVRQPFTVLHFGAKLALLRVLKQRLVVLHVVPHFAARLVEQSAVAARCRALKNKSVTL